MVSLDVVKKVVVDKGSGHHFTLNEFIQALRVSKTCCLTSELIRQLRALKKKKLPLTDLVNNFNLRA